MSNFFLLRVLQPEWGMALAVLCWLVSVLTIVRLVLSRDIKDRTAVLGNTEWVGTTVYFMAFGIIFFAMAVRPEYVMELRSMLRLLFWGGGMGVLVSHLLAIWRLLHHDS